MVKFSLVVIYKNYSTFIVKSNKIKLRGKYKSGSIQIFCHILLILTIMKFYIDNTSLSKVVELFPLLIE